MLGATIDNATQFVVCSDAKPNSNRSFGVKGEMYGWYLSMERYTFCKEVFPGVHSEKVTTQPIARKYIETLPHVFSNKTNQATYS